MFRILVALALAGLASGLAPAAEKTAEKNAAGANTAGYAHVVLFTMKKGAPADAVDEVVADCHKLLARIPAVRRVNAGRPAEHATPKVSRKDYDLGLLILVDDAEGLKAYLDHPSHLEFVKKHEKHFDMEKLRVFDFQDQKK